MSLPYQKRLIPQAKALRKEMTPQECHLWYDFLKNSNWMDLNITRIFISIIVIQSERFTLMLCPLKSCVFQTPVWIVILPPSAI